MKKREERTFSIRVQFALIFISLMVAVVVLCFVVNTLFLEKYYIRKKQNVIYDAYLTISQAAEADSYDTVLFSQKLEEVCRTYNITVCVMDVSSQIKYVSQNGGRQLEAKLLSYIFGLEVDEKKQILDSGQDYWIQICTQGDGEYLEMFGRLNSGISFIMQTPVESIRESAGLANRFLGYVGLAGALIGGIIIWMVSYTITKPIAQLQDISGKMVHLDFDAKFQKRKNIFGRENEIDRLGENMNLLSQSLEESISELKNANVELNRDIQNREKMDEMRREFLNNVSHELKTPIALIQGYAEGLQEGIDEDPESRDFYCSVIADEAGKMNTMVKKLLTLNELEFGNDAVNMERFDLVELIRSYIQSTQILTRQHEITVSMKEYEPVYVWADEFKTGEVFTNYFTNAVNHCERVEGALTEGTGEKEIVISLFQMEDKKVRVEVFNTGIPIPVDALPHLWEKFYKVDKARTREYGGSGVGLSIVKAIMDSMGQEYGVENKKDGVTFWFTLETV